MKTNYNCTRNTTDNIPSMEHENNIKKEAKKKKKLI